MCSPLRYYCVSGRPRSRFLTREDGRVFLPTFTTVRTQGWECSRVFHLPLSGRRPDLLLPCLVSLSGQTTRRTSPTSVTGPERQRSTFSNPSDLPDPGLSPVKVSSGREETSRYGCRRGTGWGLSGSRVEDYGTPRSLLV